MVTSLGRTLLLTVVLIVIGSPSCRPQEEGDCVCSCITNAIPEDAEEKAEFVEREKQKMVEELFVDKKNLSSATRKKSSATDERPSAQNVGFLGIAMLTLSGVLMLTFDADYIVRGINFVLKTVQKMTSSQPVHKEA